MASAVLYPGSPIILNIQNLCKDMINKSINIYWIKAHVGIFGNEVADTLAGAAHDLSKYTENIKIPKSFLKKTLKDETIIRWQEDWDSSEKDGPGPTICKLCYFIDFNKLGVFDPAGSSGSVLLAVVPLGGGWILCAP
ncbi:hypothetical protein JTE90_004023 [Oedothorax gibbosus]|uniref:RNase H type-1 domain-containing protein n=1 Tax=Oedothorax gibbosus TaxID=931172 RepID=A0AAV6U538_9ARAC|nr:hypothetical protein JTE90_004023 [Oedothorax gibbosus]